MINMGLVAGGALVIVVFLLAVAMNSPERDPEPTVIPHDPEPTAVPGEMDGPEVWRQPPTPPHEHEWETVGYGGAGWHSVKCSVCGERDIE